MRRGQVTMFVMLGLVVLVLVGLFLVGTRSSGPETLTAQQETAAISGLVQQCLALTGESSVRYILSQGGYHTMEDLDLSMGVDSGIVRFEPQVVPLWHEVHSCSSGGCIGDNRPSLCYDRGCPVQSTSQSDVSWQDSIETSIESNLERCFNDFAGVSQTRVTLDKEPDVHAIIRENDLFLELDLPMTLTTSDDQNVKLDKFSTTLDVDLEQLYSMATEIFVAERQKAFIEEVFLHLLATSSGLDSPIPPMRDAQLRGGTKFWITRNVRDEIETGLMPFMTFIQIPNAMESYSPITSSRTDDASRRYASGIYEYLTIKLGQRAYPLGVQFQYPYESMELDINGQEFLKGRTLPGTGFLSILGGLTFIEYKFKYNVAFPMIVKITDPYAFNGQGVDLFFGLEANIANNRPVNTSRNMLTFVAADSFLDLGSPEHLVKHEYTINVINKRTGQPVPDAGITYICGTEHTMGATGSDGKWFGRLPYCAAGGQIKIETIDYAGDSFSMDNTDDDMETTELEIGVWPRQDKVVRVFKRTEAGATSPLSSNETVITTIERSREEFGDIVPRIGIVEFGTTNTDIEKNETLAMFDQALAQGDISQGDYDEAVAHIRAGEIQLIETEILDFIPDTYSFSGFLTYYGLIQIPESESCTGIFPFRTCVTLDAQNFTSWQSGGVLLTDTDAVELTEEFVYSDRELVLYVIERPLPVDWESLQEFQPLEEFLTYERKRLMVPER